MKLSQKLADLTYKAHFNKIKARCVKAAKDERTSIMEFKVEKHTIELLESEGLKVELVDHVSYVSHKISWNDKPEVHN